MDIPLTNPDGTPRTTMYLLSIPPSRVSSVSIDRRRLGLHRPLVISQIPIHYDKPYTWSSENSYDHVPVFKLYRSRTNRDRMVVSRRQPNNHDRLFVGGWRTRILFRMYHCSRDTIPEYISHPSIYVYHGINAETVPFKTRELMIMPNVSRLHIDACNGCSNLEKVVMPDSVKIIDASCFYRCRNLKHISLSEDVRHIRFGAFAHCTNLKYIFIPSSLTHLGFKAFWECDQLEIVIFESDLRMRRHEEVNLLNAFHGCRNLFDASTLQDDDISLRSLSRYEILISRYSDLPLHRVCAQNEVNVLDIEMCIHDNQYIHGAEQDDFNRHSALHILVNFHPSNLEVDVFMRCFIHCPSALFLEDKHGDTPWDLISSRHELAIMRSVICHIISSYAIA